MKIKKKILGRGGGRSGRGGGSVFFLWGGGGGKGGCERKSEIIVKIQKKIGEGGVGSGGGSGWI